MEAAMSRLADLETTLEMLPAAIPSVASGTTQPVPSNVPRGNSYVPRVPSVPGNSRAFETNTPPKPRLPTAAVDAALTNYSIAFAELKQTKSSGVSQERWAQAKSDAAVFMQAWARQAAELGWPVIDLFEWCETGCSGLIWEMRGASLKTFTELTVEMEKDDGNTLVFLARPGT
jgi:hypothetical protein